MTLFGTIITAFAIFQMVCQLLLINCPLSVGITTVPLLLQGDPLEAKRAGFGVRLESGAVRKRINKVAIIILKVWYHVVTPHANLN